MKFLWFYVFSKAGLAEYLRQGCADYNAGYTIGLNDGIGIGRAEAQNEYSDDINAAYNAGLTDGSGDDYES